MAISVRRLSPSKARMPITSSPSGSVISGSLVQYRVNMMPYFISERTPSEKREDLWELLEEVGLDYYDRFEWLLRTNMRCGTDNLIVERADAAQN